MGVHEATPRVWLHDGAINALDGATLSWSSAVEGTVPELPMEFARRTRGRVEPPGVRDVVLLESGSTPLILLRTGPPRVVETSLDFASQVAGAEAAVPLGIGFLADVASIGGSWTVPYGPGVDRPPLAQRRSRSFRLAAPNEHCFGSGDSTIERPLLWLAVLLLAWDAALLARRLLRDSQRSAQAQA